MTESQNNVFSFSSQVFENVGRNSGQSVWGQLKFVVKLLYARLFAGHDRNRQRELSSMVSEQLLEIEEFDDMDDEEIFAGHIVML